MSLKKQAYDDDDFVNFSSFELSEDESFSPKVQMKKPAKSGGRKKRNKRAYVQQPKELRLTLIDLCLNKKMTIKDAADQLKINYSTAKYIIKMYSECGKIETEVQIRKRKRAEASTNIADMELEQKTTPSLTEDAKITRK